MRSLLAIAVLSHCFLPSLAAAQGFQPDKVWDMRPIFGANPSDPLSVGTDAFVPCQIIAGGQISADNKTIRLTDAQTRQVDLHAVEPGKQCGIPADVRSIRIHVHVEPLVTSTAIGSDPGKAALSWTRDTKDSLRLEIVGSALSRDPRVVRSTRLRLFDPRVPVSGILSAAGECDGSGCVRLVFKFNDPSVARVRQASFTIETGPEPNVAGEELRNMVTGAPILPAEQELFGGRPLSRWLVSGATTSGARAEFSIHVDLPDKSQSDLLLKPENVPEALRFLLPIGTTQLSMTCFRRTADGNEEKTAPAECGTLQVVDSSSSPILTIKVGLPAASNKIRAALEDERQSLRLRASFPGGLRLTTEPDVTDLPPEVDLVVRPGRCRFTFQQLTELAAGVSDAEVLYSVLAEPVDPRFKACPPVSSVDFGNEQQPALRGSVGTEATVGSIKYVRVKIDTVPKGLAQGELTAQFKTKTGALIDTDPVATLKIGGLADFSKPQVFILHKGLVPSGECGWYHLIGNPLATNDLIASNRREQKFTRQQAEQALQRDFGKPNQQVQQMWGATLGESPDSALLKKAIAQTKSQIENMPAVSCRDPGKIPVSVLGRDRNNFVRFEVDRPKTWQVDSISDSGCIFDRVDGGRSLRWVEALGAHCIRPRSDSQRMVVRARRTADLCSLLHSNVDENSRKVLNCMATDSDAKSVTVEGGWLKPDIELESKPFRFAANLETAMRMRCYDRRGGGGHKQSSLAVGGSITKSTPLVAIDHDATICRLYIDIPSGDPADGEAKTWDDMRERLEQSGEQRLHLSLEISEAGSQTFTRIANVNPSQIELSPQFRGTPQNVKVASCDGVTAETLKSKCEKDDESKECADEREKWADCGVYIEVDLTQREGDDLKFKEYSVARLTVNHEDEKDYESIRQLSTPGKIFDVSVRRKPKWGTWTSMGIPWRAYVTIPVSLTLLRVPHSGSSARVSSDLAKAEYPELAGFGVGAIFCIEPWNFDKNEAIWNGFGIQLHGGFLTSLPYDDLRNVARIGVPSISMITGIGFRIPPSMSPTASGGSVEAALNVVAWYELALLSNSPQWAVDHIPVSSFLFGIGGQFGSLGN